MTFVNLSLLAGTALVALPILLHLIMRRKPKLLEFPALRFLAKRHDTNQRSLRLRHLLLLLLRAAAIALLAFALARPSLNVSGGIGSQEAPVAAALVFDAAPHMQYRHENQTRLEAAKDLGLWLTAQLPEQSEIAVLDTRVGAAAAFQADRGAAKDRIERLDAVSNSQPLAAAIDAAVPLLEQTRLPRKEIYVFTDLSRGAWPAEHAARLRQQLGSLSGAGVYVIDVGVDKPTDYGLGAVRLSAEVFSSRGELTVATDVTCVGAAAQRSVELQLADAKDKPPQRREQTVEATPGELRPVEFRLGGLAPGVHQGTVRIIGQDGLAANDLRYFTVEAKTAWRVLVAAPSSAHCNPRFLTEALAPARWRKEGLARFQCDLCDLGDLAARPLANYAVVCLLDPTPLEPAVWQKLAAYAADGHGMVIFLGRNATPIDSFNDSHAQKLLPGTLLRPSPRSEGGVHLAPRDYQHPILAPFRGLAGSVPWQFFPVFCYWELGEPPAGVAAPLSYNNGRPAILERPVGQGRVLTMTTPVSDNPNRQPWNVLPIGVQIEPWPCMILVDRMLMYVARGSEEQLNYFAGQTATLLLDGSAQRQSYLLFAPGDATFPIPAELGRRDLAITATEAVGNYRVQAGGSHGVDLGFSVNYAPNETRLDRLSDAELKEMFGTVKFRLAHSREQIERDVSVGRVGRELFPPLIVMLAVALALELFVSNRFYKEI
jgi:hypothetical protein